jgi:hypothetical protein
MSKDEQPHILVIENIDEEKGEYDWYVEHLPDCPKETYDTGMWDQKHEPMEYYTCRTQAVIDNNSLDDIEDWKKLAPGRYKIKSYYEYHPGEFGGTYGEEHEIGIVMVENDD